MSKQRAHLTARVKQQYDAILRGDASSWSWPYPGWNVPNQPPSVGCVPYRNEWAAYVFAKSWCGRKGVDMKKLQAIVLASENAACAIEYARHVPGANIKRFQDLVLRNGNAKQMRKFALLVDGADTAELENMATIVDVMAL